MPNPPLASAAAKRRHWHKALGKHRARSPQTVLSMSARPLAALLECAPDGDVLMLVAPDDDGEEEEAPSLAQKLPTEMMQLVLGMLDGDSLLACALVCRALAQLTFDRDVWRNICMQRWPTLRTQTLAQLPGAPDYDVRCDFSMAADWWKDWHARELTLAGVSRVFSRVCARS